MTATPAPTADTPESVAARIDPHALTPAHGAVMIRAGLGREAAALIRRQAVENARLSAEMREIRCEADGVREQANRDAKRLAGLMIEAKLIDHLRRRAADATQAEAAAYERGRAAGRETCAAHLERLDRIGTTPTNKTPIADKETWAAAFLHFRGPMSSVIPPFKQMAALIRDIPADAIRARSTEGEP